MNISDLVNRLTPTDADRFHKLAAGFQSIVVALGLIVAGLYTGTTFWALGLRERATAELEDINRRLQHTVLDLRVEATQEVVPDESGKYVRVTVSAENKGNKEVVLDFTQTQPLILSRVKFNDEGVPSEFGPAIHARFYIAAEIDRTIEHQTIQPAEIYRYNAVVCLHEPGIYLTIFDAVVTNKRREDEPVAPISHWVASAYTVVR